MDTKTELIRNIEVLTEEMDKIDQKIDGIDIEIYSKELKMLKLIDDYNELNDTLYYLKKEYNESSEDKLLFVSQYSY